MEEAWSGVERRRQPSRRRRPTRPWDGLTGPRRRSRGRRREDRVGLYVDRYRRDDVLMVVGIFVLNLLDAFLTLRWLQEGGSEANPLMATLIEMGGRFFVLEKATVVGISLLVLVAHKNFPFARYGLWLLLGVYSALLGWHLLLQLGGVGG